MTSLLVYFRLRLTCCFFWPIMWGISWTIIQKFPKRSSRCWRGKSYFTQTAERKFKGSMNWGLTTWVNYVSVNHFLELYKLWPSTATAVLQADPFQAVLWAILQSMCCSYSCSYHIYNVLSKNVLQKHTWSWIHRSPFMNVPIVDKTKPINQFEV